MELTNNTNVTAGDCVRYDVKIYLSGDDIAGGIVVRTIFTLIYTLIFLAGVSGNTCVVLAVARNRPLQTVRNLFIVSLSASDVVVCLFSLPISASTAMFKSWEFGEVLCYTIPMFQGMSVFISTFTLTCIAIDRFILIVFPTKRPIQITHATVMIATVWLVAITMTLPMVVNQELVPFTHYSPNETNICGLFCDELGWGSGNPYRKVYGFVVLIVQYFLPLTIISTCYTMIVLKLNRGGTFNRAQVKQLSERQMAVIKRKQRTNHMLIAMVCLFALAWLPQVILNLLNDFNAIEWGKYQYLMSLIVHSMAMTSTVWNPVIYGGLNESFKEAFCHLLPCLKHFIKAPEGRNLRGNGANLPRDESERFVISKVDDTNNGTVTTELLS